MFTGIIEEMGEITAIAPAGDGWRLTVRAPRAAADAVHGESIAVSGVCLTVVGSTADTFDTDVMKQTLDVAAIGSATVGTRVNIEKAMPVGARLGGHIVQGHVDGVGDVLGTTGRPVECAAHQPARRPRPARRRQGLDLGRRHLADRERGERARRPSPGSRSR